MNIKAIICGISLFSIALLHAIETPQRSHVKIFNNLLQNRSEIDAFRAEVLNNPKPSIVKFYMQACPPCKAMKPIFEQVAQELSGSVNFIEIEASSFNDVSDQYNVQSVPVFIYFNRGQEVYRKLGIMSAGLLKTKARDYFNLR